MLATIHRGLTILNPPKIGIVGASYSHQFMGFGGATPYHWELRSSLPTGWSFDASTGTLNHATSITDASTFDVTIYLRDANWDFDDTLTFTVNIIALPLALSGDLPNETAGVAIMPYNYVATGGYGGYSFGVTAGTFPPGLYLDPATGQVTGTPTASGSYTWDVTTWDSHGIPATITDSCVIGYAAIGLTGNFTNKAGYNVSYTSSLPITGGNGVYSNARITSGALPGGLAISVSGSNLTVSGTCTSHDTAFTFSYAVDSGDGQTATGTQTIQTGFQYWADVSSQLQFDQANGSTTATDATGRVWTTHGGFQVTTSGPLYGSGSGSFNGSNAFLSAAYDAAMDFGGSAFTIDVAFKTTGTGNIITIDTDTGTAFANQFQIAIYIDGSNKLHLRVYTAAAAVDIGVSSASVSDGARHTCRLCADGASSSSIYAFLDGVLIGSLAGTYNGTNGGTSFKTFIGAGGTTSNFNSGSFFNGLIDEARFIKGHCLSTANYSPSSTPFLAF